MFFVAESSAFMNLFSKLFLIMIDFRIAETIQSLSLNFNLYLLICFDGACSSNIEFILSKKDFKERFMSCLSNLRTSNKFSSN